MTAAWKEGGAMLGAQLPPRRPGERRDPYTPSHMMRKVRKQCASYHERWLWVPACAGTTAVLAACVVRPTSTLEYGAPACAGTTPSLDHPAAAVAPDHAVGADAAARHDHHWRRHHNARGDHPGRHHHGAAIGPASAVR